jgi:CheY-like chemotaxis protein
MLDLNAQQRNLPTVLLIDDDLVSREVTATLLTLNGYTVHTAVDGAASLELLAGGECRPDVILMDAQMPGLSGAELVAELRARSQARVYTISASKPSAELAASADGFLLKPFDAAALGKLIEGQSAAEVPSFLDPNGPAISAKVLGQFRRMMPEAAVRQIYEAVAADLARRIEKLEAAIAKGDAAEIRRIGHAIKGGSGMAGALQAAHIGALLEALPAEGVSAGAKGNYLDNSVALLRDLRTAARNLERMLENGLPA